MRPLLELLTHSGTGPRLLDRRATDLGPSGDAMSVSSVGAGLLEANRPGGTVEGVHCGWAALPGGSGRAGPGRAPGPPAALEGRFGFLQAFRGDRADRDAVVRGLGTNRELPRVASKPYPCNHFTHAGVDTARRLRAQRLAPADVTAIELGVAKPVLRTIAEPPEARPAAGYHAAFGGPSTVAAALLGGGLGVSHEDFTDAAARDPPPPRPGRPGALRRGRALQRSRSRTPSRRPARDHPHGRGTRGPRRGQPWRRRQTLSRRGSSTTTP
jgi:hypothetical protein